MNDEAPLSDKFWFRAKAERGGVMISDPREPLGFVWQTREQAREIIERIEAALSE